jgi:hypothetical protein
LLTIINDNSDKKFFKYPLRKLFNNFLFDNSLANSQLNNNNFLITQNSSLNSSIINNTILNLSTTKKFSLTNSSNQSFLPSDQNLRQYKDLTPNAQNFNLNSSGN